jgi:uncharacterized membrane protein
MGLLLGVGFGIFCLITFFLPWVLRSDIASLKERVGNLERQKDRSYNPPFSMTESSPGISTQPGLNMQADSPYVATGWSNIDRESKTQPRRASMPITATEYESPIAEEPPQVSPQKQTDWQEPKRTIPADGSWFETAIASRLPVWIGAVALVFAAVYFVRYSIEIGLLSPLVRVTLGGIFGLALLTAAQFIQKIGREQYSLRISQALSGAGLSALYVSIYAATSLYNLIPDLSGFIGMAAIAGFGVFISLRQGMAIALLSMAFGFLAPALVHSDQPSAIAMFSYLYVLYAAVLLLVRQRDWWPLALIATMAVFLWTGLWLGFSFQATDGLPIMLFLIAVMVSITTITQSADPVPLNSADLTAPQMLRMGGLITATVLGFGVLHLSKYGTEELATYAIMVASMAAMTFFDEKKYRDLFLVGFAFSMISLVAWSPENLFLFQLIAASAVLFLVFGNVMLRKSQQANFWAGFGCVSLMAHYLILYTSFQNQFIPAIQLPHLWGGIALGLSALTAINGVWAAKSNRNENGNVIAAIYAFTGLAFIAVGMAIEVTRYFLPIAFGLQLLAASFVWRKFHVPGMTKMVSGLLIALVISFWPFAPLMLNLLSSVFGKYMIYTVGVDLKMLAVQFGVPALSLLAVSILLRAENINLQKLMHGMVAVLGGFGVYFLVRQVAGFGVMSYNSYNPSQYLMQPDYMLRSVLTLAILGYGIGIAAIARSLHIDSLRNAGLCIVAIAFFRTIFVDLVASNPLVISHNVGDIPLLNGLFVAYLLPAAAAYILSLVDSRSIEPSGKALATMALALLFVYINLCVRQFFHGAYLNQGLVTDAEIYSYSAAWLVFGVALMTGGIIGNNQPLRYASLAFILLTVGKVFLYDAAELTGLYRVFAFLGLGLSLISISYFYSRFVFKKSE